MQLLRWIALASSLLAAAHAAAQDACEPWFKHQQTDRFYPRAFAMVDLDPPRWPHLVGNAGYRGLEISRFGPNGAVEFLGAVSENTSYGLLAADFDGDGDTDVVVGHDAGETLHVFANSGGTLVEGPGTHIPGLLTLYFASDFDLDGLPDLLVTTRTDILLYRNAADGTFVQSAGLPFEQVYDILPATLDHDALPDVLVITVDTITPIRQRADGAFEALPPIDVYNPGNDEILSGDINGDGLTDILYEHRRVLLGEGQGDFTQGPELDPRVETLIKLVDIDRDGDLDLLVNAANADGEVSSFTMLNDGAGLFALLEHPGVFSPFFKPRDTIPEDIDGDGHLDVVAYRDRLTDIRFGSGDGYFDDVPFNAFFEDVLRRATLRDADGDGDLDVIASGDDPDPAVKILTNDGLGAFASANELSSPSMIYERTIADDLDGDGDPDILAWTEQHGLLIYENTPDGLFSETHVIQHREGAPTFVPFARDVNGDGLPEIIAGDSDGDANGYSVHINRGGWSFERRFVVQPQADHILTLADFDGDGLPDLLCADTDPQEDDLQLCYGLGDGVFDAPTPIGVLGDERPYAVPGDFNGDGWLDFVSYGWRVGDLKIMINRRDGTFEQSCVLEGLLEPRDPGVVDLDGDGFDELVASSQGTTPKAAVYSFNARGEARDEKLFGNAMPRLLGSPVGDLNADGATDIVLVSPLGYYVSGGISVFLNQCPGAPCLPDLDRDGDTDAEDLSAYLARWTAQQSDDCSDSNCTADLDRNGAIDTRDLIRFLNAWAAGC